MRLLAAKPGPVPVEEWDIIITHVHVYVSCPSAFGNMIIGGDLRSDLSLGFS